MVKKSPIGKGIYVRVQINKEKKDQIWMGKGKSSEKLKVDSPLSDTIFHTALDCSERNYSTVF